MKPLKYKIAIGNNGKFYSMKEVEGFFAFELHGHTWAVHEEEEETMHGSFSVWEVSEISTGFAIQFHTPCFDMQQAIVRAHDYLMLKTKEDVLGRIAEAKKMLEELKSEI